MASTLPGKPGVSSKPAPGKPASRSIRPVHRIVGTIIGLFTLYFAITGSSVQIIDLHTLATHAAATDPDMMGIRESIDGPPNFQVIAPTDFAAPALPEGFDFNDAVTKVLNTARPSAGADTPLKYLELRMVDSKPLGLVQEGTRVVRFDPATGATEPNPPARPRGRPAYSIRNVMKRWHRMQVLGDGMVWINALVGMGLFVMIVTGLVLYFQLLRARARQGNSGLFWKSGGWFRSIHRWVSIVAAVFLMVVSISGTLLSIDTFSLAVYRWTQPASKLWRGQFPLGMMVDASSPLEKADVPAMLNTTLAAYHAAEGDTPIKVLRLRYFAGMPQGLIITGGKDTRQLVFNASTGQPTSMTEPGYPYTGFPFGWKEHEFMKKIHRGDALGIPGRLMDLFAGLSMVFLSFSGIIMYFNLWNGRRRAGRLKPFWT